MSPRKKEPFIGITCDINLPKHRKQTLGFELACDHRYPDLVKAAGGYPVLLPITNQENIIRKYLEQVDGLVIVGGDDVDPALYGEKRKRGTGLIFKPRMEFEQKLYQEVKRLNLPILGICYGMQLINVLEGGTLFQDIRRDAKSKLSHRKKSHPYHRIAISPDSRLRKVIGQSVTVVHSDHHQAISRVAPGFKPVAFAPDGVIEAIENRSRKILAVQWHPERSFRHAASLRLFRAFVNLCR